jgi:hypothetical protein
MKIDGMDVVLHRVTITLGVCLEKARRYRINNKFQSRRNSGAQ